MARAQEENVPFKDERLNISQRISSADGQASRRRPAGAPDELRRTALGASTELRRHYSRPFARGQRLLY